MLPMVMYITNGIIPDWRAPFYKSNRDSPDLAQVAFHIIWIDGLELDSICFKKCTHAMTMDSSCGIMHIILNCE